MGPKFTAPRSSEPVSELSVTTSQQDGRVQTPQGFVDTVSSADRRVMDKENLEPSKNCGKIALLKFDNEPIINNDSALLVPRNPLADVTQKVVTRPRSLSSALAEIAKLKDDLEASERENQNLKGEIVAYQDALYQADKDAGYY